MPVINMPDGTPVAFPDDMPPEQVRRLIANKFPEAAQSVSSGAPGVDEAGMIAGAEQPAAPPIQIGPLTFSNLPERTGKLPPGVQGAGKGLAELVSGIPDLVNTGVNVGLAGMDKTSQAVGGPNLDFRFPMASQEIAKTASNLGEKVGIATADPEAMNFKDRGLYNVNRFGTQVAGAIPALARVGAKRAGEIVEGDALPKWYDALVKPYAGETAGRTIAGDAAGAAGSGLGVTMAQEFAPDNPLAEAGGAIGGGVGGVTALSAAESLGRMLTMLGRRMFGGNIAKDIPLDPESGATTSRKAATEASRIVQNEAVDPAGAISRMDANRADLEGNIGVLPAPAALAEDPGLAALDRNVRRGNPGESVARDQKFQTAVRDTVDQVAPESATTEPLVRRAQSEIDRRTNEAQRQVDRTEQRSDRVAGIRESHGREVADYEGQGPAASQALHSEIVENGYRPARAAKNAAFDAIDPQRTNQVNADPVIAAAQRVRAGINQLGPQGQQLPGEFIQAIERLAPDIQQQPSAVLGPDGAPIMRDVNVGGPGTAALGDLVDVRKYMTSAYERAQQAGNFELADNIRELRSAINRVVEQSPQAASANARYRDFSDTYRPQGKSEMAGFTREIDRGKEPPPSQTAGRFMRPGRSEASAELQRAMEASGDPANAQAAARQYLMSDLAGKNVVDARTGFIRPNALRKWATANENNLDLAPGFRQEIEELIARTDKGERVGGRVADDLRRVRQEQKITEAQINRSALSDVVGADPDKTVAAIMSNPNSSGQRLKELISLTAGDDAARNGLKAAVRDFIIDKATNTASEKLVPGDTRGPVSFAKLTKIFNEHEKELAQIFGPEEMNTLRAGHRALELANVDRLRTTVGSDTAEKVSPNIVEALSRTPLGKGIEAFARFKFGLLQAGGMKATARRLAEGIGSEEQQEIRRLVERATVDPDLMRLLLGRDVPVNSPRWNSKLNKLLGAAEFGRQEYGDE